MLRVFEPNIGQHEIAAATRTLAARRVSPGAVAAEFARRLCKVTQAKHAICCNSGTTALYLAISAMAGDGVITFPSYTFLAGANAALMADKTVVLAPIGRDLTVLHVPARQKHALAIFVSHNARVEKLASFTAAYAADGVPVLHDAAQSLGRFTVGNGTATVSFSGPKIATTGQGGAVLTGSDEVADRCRRLLDHGGGNWRKTRIHEAVGGNFRMADVNAAIGLAQLDRLDELLAIRRERFAWYRRHFPDMPDDGWCALVRTTKATECIEALASGGYEALQPYRPVQESAPYRHLALDPDAVRAAGELLYLPVHYMVTERDVDRLAAIIKGIDQSSVGA